MFVVVWHLMWLTSCVVPGFRHCSITLPSMCLQAVSGHQHAWPRSTHALHMAWDLALPCMLALWPHVCCCTAPHVAAMLCCPWLFAWDQCSFFHGLAACECSLVCIAKVMSCFVHVSRDGIASSSCSIATCLFLCCTTSGLRVVLPLVVGVGPTVNLLWACSA